MENKKKSFVLFPADFLAAVHSFRKQQTAELIIALCEHNLFGKISKPVSEIVKERFDSLQSVIDANNARYAETCEKNKANAIKGGRPKKPTANRTVSQSKPNPNHNESDDDNDHESVNENDLKKGNVAGAPSVDDIVRYCQRRGVSVDPVKFIDFYDKRGWRAGKDYVALNWQKYVDDWDYRSRGLQPEDDLRPIGASLAKIIGNMEAKNDDR